MVYIAFIPTEYLKSCYTSTKEGVLNFICSYITTLVCVHGPWQIWDIPKTRIFLTIFFINTATQIAKCYFLKKKKTTIEINYLFVIK